MICQACGTENDNQEVNCIHCGKTMVEAPCVRTSNDACAAVGMQGKSLGIAALILACMSFVFGGLSVPAATVTVIAIVLCAIATQKSSQLGLVNKDAKVGMVYAIIAIAALAVNFVLTITLVIALLILYVVLCLLMCAVAAALIVAVALV